MLPIAEPENNRKRVGSTVGTNHAHTTKRTVTWMPTDSLFRRSNIAREQRDALAAAMAPPPATPPPPACP